MPKRELRTVSSIIREELKDPIFARNYADIASCDFGNTLKDIRESAGLTQSELAVRLGVTRPRVSQIESTEGNSISLEVLNKFASACGFKVQVSFHGKRQELGMYASTLSDFPEYIYSPRTSGAFKPASEKGFTMISDKKKTAHPYELIAA